MQYTCCPSSNLRKCFIIIFFSLIPAFMILNVLLDKRSFYSEMTFKGLNLESGGYLIKTPGCKILNFEPKPPAMKKYFKLSKKIRCNRGSRYNITSSEMNFLYFYPENIWYKNLGDTQRSKYYKARAQILKDHSGKAIKEFLSVSHTTCCYKSIKRVTQKRDHYNRAADNGVKYGKVCYEVVKFKTMITKYDAVIVFCKSTKSTFYVNVHHLVQRKSSENNSSSIDQSSTDKLNVLFFGTDSLSRLAFLRDNPKTFEYLMNDLKAYEFKGLNKVGENTLPNLAVVLSGMSINEMLENCFKKQIDLKIKDSHYRPSDDCPLIWKDFKRKGYITAMVEDKPLLGLFNYKRLGFVIPPTDHYTRPGFLAATKEHVTWNNDICHGQKLSYDILHDYSRDFLYTYKNESTFGFFWGTSLTHDVLNYGVFTDEPHVKYLESLKNSGVLNNTILFFLSDHGLRFGKFRQTYMGKFEENLPYLFIVVPEWFKKSYPEVARNLKENNATLLTPFDVHETLRDILDQRYLNSSYLIETPMETKRNISLFQKLPTSRTCNDIGIPLKYCACQEYTPMENTNNIFKDIAKYVKDYINGILKIYPECLEIRNLTISKAVRGFGEESVFKRIKGEIISVQAKYVPGNAKIEATLIWDKNSKTSPFQISGDISRINSYGNQSYCVTDAEVSKLCICKDIL